MNNANCILYHVESSPWLYGLPKKHEEEAPSRPLIISFNTVAFNITKYVIIYQGPTLPFHVGANFQHVLIVLVGASHGL